MANAPTRRIAILVYPDVQLLDGDHALGQRRPVPASVPARGARGRSPVRARRQHLDLGGVTAGMDLALALVEADHDRRLAIDTARHLVMYAKRPGTQSQFGGLLADQSA